MAAEKDDSSQKHKQRAKEKKNGKNSGATPSKPSQAAGERKADLAPQGGFPVVGIGASAGGLEAIEGFFSHARPDGNMAYVIIQHLAPGHKSIMDSLLKKYTEMDVLQVKDGMKIKPNCVYLNPPDKDVVIMNGRLYLTEPTHERGARLPIDHFFRSLADDQNERAICVILSGTGTDGTLGLKAIKGAGGMSMVQDQNQARYDNMPRSATDTGLVDFILPVEGMFGELVKYAKHPYIDRTGAPPKTEEKFSNIAQKIFMLIRSQTGHDFSHYKQNTIRRRIERRMAVHQIGDISEYLKHLRQNDLEIEALFKDMLITVTNFFRDPEAFIVLEKKVIPKILADKGADSAVRVWVPGCATGEEAYSVAILLAEGMDRLGVHPTVQIFATDIDHDAVECARQAVYPDSIAADVSSTRLKHFFTKEDSSYRVKKPIREMVVFATQNLIKDPPFSKLDLVCCRNVLIYMDSVLQKKILPLFHYTLNPAGYLFLGTSETIGNFVDHFSVVDSKWKVFKRKEAKTNNVLEHLVMPFSDTSIEVRRAEPGDQRRHLSARQLAERVILQNYAPPCVLINSRHEILYFHGNTEKFLTPPTGEATFDILKMVRSELRYKLNNALHRAIKERKTVTIKGVKVNLEGRYVDVDMMVRPVIEAENVDDMLMVIFQSKEQPAKPAADKSKDHADRDVDTRVEALEQELQSTKEYLQTTIEELETSNEELKSTNEELQSTNEELQSTNEELETSREELQSTNEELETVNSELQDKVEQLSNTNDDLNNLLSSTQIGTMFLDMELRVKRFTPTVKKIFNLIQTDIGRPISDLTSTLEYQGLRKDAEETLRTLVSKEFDVQAVDGSWYSIRILPYRTVENVIGGVVITFVDMTKQVEQAEQVRFLSEFPEQNPNPVLRVSADGTLLYANASSKPLQEKCGREKVSGELLKVVREAIDTGRKRQIDVECRDKTYTLTLAPIRDANFVNVYGMDVTGRKT